MEDVLDVYHRPSSASNPVVGVDEPSQPQVKEPRDMLPACPGEPERYDDAYERHGVSHLLMMFAPREGLRHVKVTDQRTNVDWASGMKDFATVHCPHADKITVVMDNVETPGPAALYEALAPEEAHSLLERFACLILRSTAVGSIWRP